MNQETRLIKLAQHAVLPLALAIILGLLASITIIVQARYLSTIIGGILLEQTSESELLGLFGGLVITIIFRGIFTAGAETSTATIGIRVKEFVRIRILHVLFQRGPIGLGNERSGELAAVATQAVDALDGYFSQYLPQLALAVLVPLTILVIVFPVDVLSALVLCITAPLIPLFMLLIGKGAERVTRHQFQSLQRMSAYFLDVLQGLPLIKSLNQSDNVEQDVAQSAATYRITTMQVLRVTFLSALVLEVVGTLSTAVVAVQIGLRVLYDQLNFIDGFFILLLAPEFYLVVRQLGLRFHAATSARVAAKRIFEILDLQVQFDNQPEEISDGIAENVDHIEFKDVGYQYPGSDPGMGAGVYQINLTIKRGKMVALVGPSGAGKSTIGRLLMGFIFPSEGTILINDRVLNHKNVVSWREKVSWLPQNPYIFAGSMADNIRLGAPSATMDEIRNAAKAALLDEWISRLPDAYNTQVGEGGLLVSGGQLQRIAIARALLQNTDLILWDEPVSHLDFELENSLEITLRHLAKTKLVLIVAHRKRTIMGCDQVYFVCDGRIIESGTPQALLQGSGGFAKMMGQYRGGD